MFRFTICLPVCLVVFVALFQPAIGNDREQDVNSSVPLQAAAYRGPVGIVVAEDGKWAATVNELAGTISLIDLTDLKAIDEVSVGGRPAAICGFGGNQLLVSSRETGLIHRLEVSNGRIVQVAKIKVGYDPLGLAVSGTHAYCGLMASGEIAELDLSNNSVRRKFPVGRWPRFLTVSPDGSRIAVGLSGESSIAVLERTTGEILYEEPIVGGINIGHMVSSSDGAHVYFPWMVYRSNPITVGFIRRGWVLASRVARIRWDGPSYREAISLDVPRRAVADPHGLAVTPDEKRMAVTSSGTHELLVYRLPDLPFIGSGGPGDLIDEKLLRDNDLFFRIELGGRPMGCVALADNRSVVVANHLLDCVQIVDLQTRQVVHTVPLGDVPNDDASKLVHRGMEIFHDASRSLDQWYSCNSCHLDGGSNAKPMDTWNDGTELTAKTVLPLADVVHTGPWTWHGWQEDLDASIQNSFVSTMQGEQASKEDVDAVRVYLQSLTHRPSPFLEDGTLSPSAQRGKALFHDGEIGCSECHAGSKFTDGLVHDVGMSRDTDKYQGYNTPSLLGIYRKTRFLHDGRAKSLQAVLKKWHSPAEISGGPELSKTQLQDLIAYLKSL